MFQPFIKILTKIFKERRDAVLRKIVQKIRAFISIVSMVIGLAFTEFNQTAYASGNLNTFKLPSGFTTPTDIFSSATNALSLILNLMSLAGWCMAVFAVWSFVTASSTDDTNGTTRSIRFGVSALILIAIKPIFKTLTGFSGTLA